MLNSLSKPQILVTDDEQDIRELLRLAFEPDGWHVVEAGDLAATRRLLDQDGFDLCITDMRLPDGNGIELVEQVSPDIPVIVITAYGSVETAVQALKAGAFDFVAKPIDTDLLRVTVQRALARRPGAERLPSALIGDSQAMMDLRRTVERLAGSQAPVVIVGETGTGKKHVAQEIHRVAASGNRPFVAVDCAALPADRMIEAFFGGPHAEAVSDYPQGFLRAAVGGTLYLDEVAALPPFMQAKLLNVLQERRLPSLEGEGRRVFDARLISSSTTELKGAVQSGGLRHDLYFRLNVIELRVPPLRERGEDLPALVNVIRDAIRRRWGRPVPALSRAALERLECHDFPGNLVELENVVERAAALAQGLEIRAEELQFASLDAHEAQAEAVITGSADDLQGRLEANERAAILGALEQTRWNRTAAARLLGLTFRQLRYRIKKFGLDSHPG